MRSFKKISFEQFKKDVCDSEEMYNSYNLPIRKTKFAAGYDFELIFDISLKPGEVKKVPTGIKAQMDSNDVLMLYVRSSLGFKYNIRLTNQVGVIDGDYYNNINNEGHIWISIQNHSSNEVTFKKGEAICQGMFIKYEVIDDEVTPDNIRVGGFGSTNNEK